MPQERNKTSILEKLDGYFRSCPFLEEGIISAEYVGGQDIRYSINSQNIADPIIEQYIDGSTKRQYAFTFNSNELFGPDAVDQFKAYKFYEDLSEWIEENNLNGVLPNIDGAQEIQLQSQGYLYTEDQSSAVYQIQLKLIYLKERKHK